MTSWVITEVILAIFFAINTIFFLRSRNKEITELRRQQFRTAFWVLGILMILGALYLIFREYQ